VFVPRALTAFASSLVAAAAFVPSFVPSLVQAQTAAQAGTPARAQTSPLVVQNAWLRKPPGVDAAAVYFVLKNPGAKPVTVVGVTSTIATHVMIHETSLVDGLSRMRMKDRIVVEPGKSVAFAPEGIHVMLSGFKYDVAVGDNVALTLQLEGGGQVNMSAAVRPLDAK
jgi:copper(I)-binding protein